MVRPDSVYVLPKFLWVCGLVLIGHGKLEVLHEALDNLIPGGIISLVSNETRKHGPSSAPFPPA